MKNDPTQEAFTFESRSLYPALPGYKDIQTSREAAERIAPRAATLRAKVLEVFRRSPGGLTADEAAANVHESILAVRPRVTELVQMGLLEDSGNRGRNESGSRAKIWVVVPQRINQAMENG